MEISDTVSYPCKYICQCQRFHLKKNFYMTQMEKLDTVKILQEKCFYFLLSALKRFIHLNTGLYFPDLEQNSSCISDEIET